MAISLGAAGLSAANLLLDFDFIRAVAARRNMPKWMEWYSGFSLMVSSNITTLDAYYTRHFPFFMRAQQQGGSASAADMWRRCVVDVVSP